MLQRELIQNSSIFSYQLSVISYQNIDIQYIQGEQIYLTNYRIKSKQQNADRKINNNALPKPHTL